MRRMDEGEYTVLRPAFERRVAMNSFAAMPPTHPMTALLELDISQALARINTLQHHGTRVSLFAFLVHAIARAISEYPDMNLVRHGKRLLRFRDVDVSVPIEVSTSQGAFPRALIIRRAQELSPAEVYAALEGARARYERAGEVSAEDRRYRRNMRLMQWLPGFLRTAVMRLIMRSGFRIKSTAGTTIVSSIGKFASVPGFGFSFTTGPRAAAFTIGTVVERPWVHEGRICIRSILALSVMVNHDLVDGAPAARFVQCLQQLIESADGLPTAAPSPPPSVDAALHARSRLALSEPTRP
jgi:pyruvate/2-oxoglutarate dehydrogenase complex dihydrolipoamide acyltransferase (E2) component